MIVINIQGVGISNNFPGDAVSQETRQKVKKLSNKEEKFCFLILSPLLSKQLLTMKLKRIARREFIKNLSRFPC